MQLARERESGEIVEAEYLRARPPDDRDAFICRGCSRPVVPAAFLPGKRVRPYFSAREGHDPDCEELVFAALVQQAAIRPMATLDGALPVSYPDRLNFVEQEDRPDWRPSQPQAAGARGERDRAGGPPRAGGRWAARTIRPICRLFIDLPFDREYLWLRVPGVPANSYGRAFLRLGNASRHVDRRIYYAPLRWKVAPEIGPSSLTVTLNAGATEGGQLVRPVRVRFGWESWPTRHRKYVLEEIEDAREEARAGYRQPDSGRVTPRWRDQTEAWLFFIGLQDPSNEALFVVDDHRTVCCLYARLRTPTRP